MDLLATLFAELSDPWPEACFLAEPAGELVAANQAGARMLGMPVRELAGKRLTDFVVNPADKVLQHLAVCVRNRQPIPGVLSCRDSAGQEVHYRSIGYRIDARPDGRPLVFLRCSLRQSVTSKFVVLNQQLEKQQAIQDQLLKERDHLQREIAERKRAEEELRKASALLAMIIENIPNMIFLKDARDLRFVRFNHAAEELLGCTREDLLGKNDHDLFPRDQADFFTEKDREVLRRKTILDIPEEPLLTSAGVKRTLHTTKVPILDARGEPEYLLGISEDITDRKQAEEEKLAIEKHLQQVQKLESLGVLAGGIAHDFNNILTAIIGNADLALMRINRVSPATENLRRIEEAASRAADLAKQMLAYSGKGKFVVESIDLNSLLEEMLNMLQVSISKKAVLRLNLHPHLPAVKADATQIRQIVMNLVINASEAIADKSGVIAITTGCMDCDRNYLKDIWLDENISEGLYVYLEVADTGCGMNRETMAKIFDPFFTTKFTGRGLGMAAVLGIVRGHKGAIRVYSEPGKGTTFKILLPAASKPAELFNHDCLKDHWRGEGKVLLVDDEETVRGIGAEMLKELGFVPLTAEDGREAILIYRENPDIAFVILDLTMPHMDGEECFRELRRLNPDIKVIMSSGYNEQEVTQKFVGKGLFGFIQKPYKVSSIREVIRKIL
ncbi:hypothetical protein GURASL_28050 [Geotalea uraniireducens]|uniref:histidine kinase n=2 Tax=Geotalea uraniireducens TaxID=351604 RepID=A0ABN6VWC0_9BACT|nr:hypothetical protein GURASL_28050 [Geotalea uraniireducens]